MCGIFAYISLLNGIKLNKNKLKEASAKSQIRGPDITKDLTINENIFFDFHRLTVNGLDHESDQPFSMDGIYLICNGEIYNFRELYQEYGIEPRTHSDCEVIIHLYKKFGIENMLPKLDGVFAFVLYDSLKDELYVARDPIGIRSLYYMKSDEYFAVCSEMKSLVPLKGECTIQQFPPGKYYSLSSNTFTPFYEHNYTLLPEYDEENILRNIRELLVKAVDKRIMSDRPICCLLSGGLDSTLITALVNRRFMDGMAEKEYLRGKLNTYAIGLEGSPDLYYAGMAADYLGTNHTNIVVSEQEFLDAIEETIYQIESYCTTTVRASVGNYLVCKYIKKGPGDDTVVFCGDLSDELFGSYRGFGLTDDPDSFFRENVKMLQDVHFFDVLRSDKSISGAGLEARVPFADRNFVQYVMSLRPEWKAFTAEKPEKWLLRQAFSPNSTGEELLPKANITSDILPKDLLWRRKEAFSDGVSHETRSWYEIIQEYVDTKVDAEALNNIHEKYPHNTPYDKESLYYRMIFEKYYGECAETIPYFWRHPFSSGNDPSARTLENY